MPYVSFISAPGCLLQSPPLRPCPDDHVAPFRCLRHGKAPNARPPVPYLPKPLVDLVHVAHPTAIHCCFVCGSKLELFVLEVSQLLWYGGSSY